MKKGYMFSNIQHKQGYKQVKMKIIISGIYLIIIIIFMIFYLIIIYLIIKIIPEIIISGILFAGLQII